MRRVSLLLILCFASTSLLAAISPADFAFEASLGDSDNDLQKVDLPIDLLLDLQQADLNDIAVFNRDGKAMPYHPAGPEQEPTAATRAAVSPDPDTLERD